MSWLRMIAARVQGLFRARRSDAELEEELQAHLEALTQKNIARGMSPEEARYATRREFGGLEQAKENYRDRRGLPFFETLAQDLRYAARMLVKNLGFAAVVIFTLALGIGANTAIFSVVHSVLLQPLPYPNPERLAIVWSIFGKEGRAPASGPELVFLRERSRLFEEFGGIWAQSGALIGKGEPEHLKLGLVTSNFLSLLSTEPQLGRFFLPGEQGSGSAKVIILSDSLWRRKFGADVSIIGQPLRLDGQSFVVVGVLRKDFRVIFPDGASVPPDLDAYVPFSTNLAEDPRDQCYIRIIGRLRRGVTIPQAQAELEGIAAQLRAQFVEFSEQGLGLQVVPLQGDVVRNLRPAVLALFGGVGLILLIACANVANLVLSHSSGRQREITIRSAIGASRGRVIRQLLTESMLLSCLGGAAGLLFGWWALKLILSLRPAGMEKLGSIDLNPAVFWFTSIVTILSGILCGLAPAVGITKTNLVESLKEGGRTIAVGRQYPRELLVVCEVALGFVLLIGAGLMARTFAQVLRVDPGFQSDHVLTFRVSLAGGKYMRPESTFHFLHHLQKNLSGARGIDSVGVVSHLPFDDSLPNWYSYYWPEGAPKSEQYTLMADHRSILPGYFQSLRARFIAGRDFDQFDAAENRSIAVIDDVVADRAWPNTSAVGKKLNIENGDFVRDSVEVIGVVHHLQFHSLTDQVRGEVYLLYPRAVRQHMAFTVKSSVDPMSLVPVVRKEVAKLDKDLPVYAVQPMDEYVARARQETRFTTMLAGIMAGIALLLACAGVYGVVAYSVSRRISEIAIRLALGAQPLGILEMIVRQNMAPVVSGVLVGFLLSLVLTPLISSLLFGVRPTDPATFAAGCAAALGVGVLACYLPARRAMRVDPMVVLRCE
jgi:putative ABC transport system permease protein